MIFNTNANFLRSNILFSNIIHYLYYYNIIHYIYLKFLKKSCSLKCIIFSNEMRIERDGNPMELEVTQTRKAE